MVEPTGHCPYLGLKQNRAIRFASPTPEHRCYVSGEPLEIPVDQATYCLSQGHVQCPLYMGLSLPTTADTVPIGLPLDAAGEGGLRGWYATLSPRDRAIYAVMLAILALIIATYLFAGVRTFLAGGDIGDNSPLPTISSVPSPSTQPVVAVAATSAVTSAATQRPPEPTSEPPTSAPESPTAVPATAVLIPPPSPRPTNTPTETPTATPTDTIVPTAGPAGATSVAPTRRPPNSRPA
ncbi:MAG TPA: hypothetical protein VFX76_12555, partial [Roseiflexaceae bacterium]|nr:hypothetical protein [Roseiflexaceae bacterium]